MSKTATNVYDFTMDKKTYPQVDILHLDKTNGEPDDVKNPRSQKKPFLQILKSLSDGSFHGETSDLVSTYAFFFGMKEKTDEILRKIKRFSFYADRSFIDLLDEADSAMDTINQYLEKDGLAIGKESIFYVDENYSVSHKKGKRYAEDVIKNNKGHMGNEYIHYVA